MARSPYHGWTALPGLPTAAEVLGAVSASSSSSSAAASAAAAAAAACKMASDPPRGRLVSGSPARPVDVELASRERRRVAPLLPAWWRPSIISSAGFDAARRALESTSNPASTTRTPLSGPSSSAMICAAGSLVSPAPRFPPMYKRRRRVRLIGTGLRECAMMLSTCECVCVWVWLLRVGSAVCRVVLLVNIVLRVNLCVSRG